MLDNDATVGALVHTILLERCADPDSDPSPWANRITRFVLQQRRAMPAHTGTVLTLLTLLLDFSPFLSFGKPFHCLMHPERQVVMAGWRRARLSPCQDLLRLHEALTLFAWHTREEAIQSDG